MVHGEVRTWVSEDQVLEEREMATEIRGKAGGSQDTYEEHADDKVGFMYICLCPPEGDTILEFFAVRVGTPPGLLSLLCNDKHLEQSTVPPLLVSLGFHKVWREARKWQAMVSFMDGKAAG